MSEKNYQQIIKGMSNREMRKEGNDYYFKINNDYGIMAKPKYNKKDYTFEIVYLN